MERLNLYAIYDVLKEKHTHYFVSDNDLTATRDFDFYLTKMQSNSVFYGYKDLKLVKICEMTKDKYDEETTVTTGKERVRIMKEKLEEEEENDKQRKMGES